MGAYNARGPYGTQCSIWCTWIPRVHMDPYMVHMDPYGAHGSIWCTLIQCALVQPNASWCTPVHPKASWCSRVYPKTYYIRSSNIEQQNVYYGIQNIDDPGAYQQCIVVQPNAPGYILVHPSTSQCSLMCPERTLVHPSATQCILVLPSGAPCVHDVHFVCIECVLESKESRTQKILVHPHAH